jgi:hypothetical protein
LLNDTTLAMPFIRNFDDLMQVPDSQMPSAVRALSAAIRQHRLWAAAAASTSRVRDKLAPFPGFEWAPSVPTLASPAARQPSPVTRETAIVALPLSKRAKRALEQRNILALEDLSAATESEVLQCPDIDQDILQRLRELLAGVGLAFEAASENPPPAQPKRSTSLRRVAPKSHRGSSMNSAGTALTATWSAP